MTRIAVIGGGRNETSVEIADTWRNLGLDACLLTPFEASEELVEGDVAVARLDILPSLDGIEPGLYVLPALAERGVRVINGSGTLMNVHDKLRTSRLLATAGLPSIPTLHIHPGD